MSRMHDFSATAETVGGPERVVVVGFGPVAARLVDELLPAVRSGTVSLLVIGEETAAAYNRVLVADLGVGRTTREAIELADAQALRAEGVDVRLGQRVQRIDRARRQVIFDNGNREPYDRLVFATGARSVVPNLHGLNPDPAAIHLLPAGVTALRDLADARRLHRAVKNRQHIVVLGGGILGLEAALAASDEGARVTVVHHGPVPLARNTDLGGGSVLATTLRRRGVQLLSNARSTGVLLNELPAGGHSFSALVLDDGSRIEADLLLLSCGVRPRIELAEGCGLPVDRGILVNHRLEADPERRIFAIGDCAEVLCSENACETCPPRAGQGPSGLIGPGWRQAEWLAGVLVSGGLDTSGDVDTALETRQSPDLEPERPGVILLKARGVDFASAGETQAELWDINVTAPAGIVKARPPRSVAQWADPEHGRYVKMVTRNGVLEGLVCVGMPRTAAELILLFESGAELPQDRSVLLRLDGPEQDARSEASAVGPESTVCRCTGATLGKIQDSVGCGNSTVEAVGRATRAGTGCGGCRDRIVSIIAEYQRNLNEGSETAPVPAAEQDLWAKVAV